MKETLLLIGIFAAITLIFLILDKNRKSFDFMSRDHSAVYRGIAALIIMFQHVGGAYGTRLLTPLGGTGVAIFLISSGYGLNESYKKKSNNGNSVVSVGGYWLPKLLRVFIPYAIFETILIPVYGDFSWKSWLLDITCIEPYNWYLNIILLCYIVFFIVSFKRIYKYRYIVLGVFSLMLFFFGDSLWAEQAISFTLGVWISDNKEKAQKGIENNFVLIGLFVTSGAFLALKQLPALRTMDGTYLWYAMQLVMKTSLALGIIGFTYRASKIFDNKFLAFIGGISLEIYLVHYRLLFILQSDMNVLIQIPLFIWCSVLGAWMFNQLIKHVTKCVQKLCDKRFSKI